MTSQKRMIHSEMKKSQCFWLLLATFIAFSLANLSFTRSASAKAQGFACSLESGVPTTIALMPDGKRIPVIRWVSDVFSADGWSPQRRCEAVSERFTYFNNRNMMRFLTTGTINKMPVICVALNKGDRCNGLVYTLKPGQNPTTTLQRLFGVQRTASGPLNETGEALYIDMGAYLGGQSSDQMPPMSTGDNLLKW